MLKIGGGVLAAAWFAETEGLLSSGPESSSHQGVEWAYRLQLLGTVAGVAALVTGYIIAHPHLLMGGVALLITNGIGAYYGRDLLVLPTLNQYVNALTNRLKESCEQLKTLASEVSKLQEADDSFKKKLDEAKEMIASTNKQLESATGKLKVTTGQLKAESDKVAKLAKLSEIQKATLAAQTKNLQEFNEQNTLFAAEEQKLEGDVSQFNGDNDALKKLLGQLDDEEGHLAAQLPELKKEVGEFQKGLNLAKKLAETTQKNMVELRKRNGELEGEIKKLSETALRVDQVEQISEKKAAELKSALEIAHHLQGLEALNHLDPEKIKALADNLRKNLIKK